MINTYPYKSSGPILQFLDKNELDEMTHEQKKWAENQYRVMYAGMVFIIKQEQISKVFTEMQHQKRIKNNLLNVEKSKDQQIRQHSQRFKQKMESYGQKRQKKFNQKVKTYKLNEQKWNKKIETIESKFKHQNREAIQKAEKYRQQSQHYWRNKEVQLATSREAKFRKLNLNRTQHSLGKNQNENLLTRKNHQGSQSLTKRGKLLRFKIKINPLERGHFEQPFNSDRSQVSIKNIRTIDIDGQISKHRQKSQMIQQQKEMIVFQNAMRRLAKIQVTRKKGQKLKQLSKSPVEIRKPKRKIFDLDDLYSGKQTQRKNHSFLPTQSKQTLLDESIQAHIKAKRIIEQQKIKERDKILENQQKRKRQDKILKAIKNKIKDIKSSTIKMQTLQ